MLENQYVVLVRPRMKIATGEIADNPDGKEYARKGGLKGGKSRAKKLTAERRKEIAKKAAQSRWR